MTDAGNLMSKSVKASYLSDLLLSQSKDFSKKRTENKAKALFFKLAVTSLSGATTVLLGLQGIGHQNDLRNVALLLSAWVTLLSTWDSFFNHRGLWARYTATCTALRAIKSDLDYLLLNGDGAYTEQQIDELHDRYRSVIRDTNEWWNHEREGNGKTG